MLPMFALDRSRNRTSRPYLHPGYIPMAEFPLTPQHPDRVVYEGQILTIGVRSYLLLSLVLAHAGEAPFSEIAPVVYGDIEVHRSRIDGTIFRLNAKLARAGCPYRFTVDGDRVR